MADVIGRSAPLNDQERRERAHRLIPAGGHTYSKGDDQFPSNAPAFIARGKGAMVWDADDREFLDWGMGLRAVVLGHAYEPVVAAAKAALDDGCNFVRPATIEADVAEALLELLPHHEMVKFAKNGSDVTTAAVRLARAHTGRNLIAIAKENPFYSFDDWFIGTTPVDAGIPAEFPSLTLTFPYGDVAALEALFTKHDDIAAVLIEPALTAPRSGERACHRCAARRGEPAASAECANVLFLQAARDITRRHGAVLVFDEMLTGFRWHLPAVQVLYGVAPDLACFGKAFGNGFSVAALTGTREIMELGGIRQASRPKVFLLSATHGGETHALAAALAVIREMQARPVIDHLWQIGGALQRALADAATRTGMSAHAQVGGYPCAPSLDLVDQQRRPSAELRTLFLQETIARGVLMPYIAPSFSHTQDHVVRTAEAAEAAFAVCRRAIDDGVEKYLQGPAVKPVFRRFN